MCLLALVLITGCGAVAGTGSVTGTDTTGGAPVAIPDTTTTDAATTADTTTTTDSVAGGPCNGNPCIGDWQAEAAKGGSVVQCNDGTWSHAGGISGACSDHGGESSGSTPPVTPSIPPATAPATTATTPPPAAQLSNSCWQASNGSGDYLATNPDVSCGFANNVFYEYWQVTSADPTQSADITAWSPVTQQSYSLSCTPGSAVVLCTSTTGAHIQFTSNSIIVYTDAEAQTYANSGKLGPNG